MLFTFLFFGKETFAGPGHDARSPMAWFGLGKHAPDHPERYDGYLSRVLPIALTFKRPKARFDRARLIPLNSIDRSIKEPVIEELPELVMPEQLEEEVEAAGDSLVEEAIEVHTGEIEDVNVAQMGKEHQGEVKSSV